MQKFGVIFDCDGTLIDSLDDAVISFNYALKKVGSEPKTLNEIKKYFGAGADRMLIQLLSDEKKGLQAFEYYIEHQTERSVMCPLHPGVRELLTTLKNKNIPMALVTGRHSRDLEVVLKPHSLESYFVTMITDDQVSLSKPAPDGILLAAERMGLSAQNTLYVGDSGFDMGAAHNARAKAVLAAWDKAVNLNEMLALKPHYIAKTPQDVWTGFQNFFAV